MEFKPYQNHDRAQTIVLSDKQKAVQSHYIAKVYTWMAAALALTGLCAYAMASNPAWVYALASHQILFFGLIIAEFGLVIYLSARLHKMSINTAVLAFMGYAVLNGITLSLIFLVYTAASISSTFFITAGTFAVMSFYGYTTKTDLTKLGKILIMLLIGLVIASVVNIFMQSSGLYWIISYVGVAVFVGLIAYDTQKIKRFFIKAQNDETTLQKLSVIGALTLYLDFINLFLFLLRILGGRRN